MASRIDLPHELARSAHARSEIFLFPRLHCGRDAVVRLGADNEKRPSEDLDARDSDARTPAEDILAIRH